MYRFGFFEKTLLFMFQLCSVIMAQNSNCNYYQNMQTGLTYYVYNGEYPNYYGQNYYCQWVAVAPANSVITVNCNTDMPNNYNCFGDQLLISLNGETPNRQNSAYLCGVNNNKTFVTTVSNVTIVATSGYGSRGGRFMCTLQVTSTSTPTNTSTCNCGWRYPGRIIGGSATNVNEFPMMAALYNSQRRTIFCGATIIGTKYALTAAHCVDPRADVTIFGLIVGEYDISTDRDTNATRVYYLKSFIVHPDFGNVQGGPDIAITVTQQDIVFSARVGPACLPFAYYQNNFQGQTVTLLGWGQTEYSNYNPSVLLATDVDVLSYQDCSNSVGGSQNMLCTFRQGRDACQGDDGGPVLWMDKTNQRFYIVGVISNQFTCASNRPTVNTRVTSYLSWIMSVTPDVCFCNKGPNN